ncbi:MAG: hypothetical protein LBL34_06115 [Clostridiales bacterium]|jgi:hypothetical protein|nr:hypothetical protein [Clostridiales bacterium]
MRLSEVDSTLYNFAHEHMTRILNKLGVNFSDSDKLELILHCFEQLDGHQSAPFRNDLLATTSFLYLLAVSAENHLGKKFPYKSSDVVEELFHHSVKKTIENYKTESSKDINLMMQTMQNISGADADIALIAQQSYPFVIRTLLENFSYNRIRPELRAMLANLAGSFTGHKYFMPCSVFAAKYAAKNMIDQYVYDRISDMKNKVQNQPNVAVVTADTLDGKQIALTFDMNETKKLIKNLGVKYADECLTLTKHLAQENIDRFIPKLDSLGEDERCYVLGQLVRMTLSMVTEQFSIHESEHKKPPELVKIVSKEIRNAVAHMDLLFVPPGAADLSEYGHNTGNPDIIDSIDYVGADPENVTVLSWRNYMTAAVANSLFFEEHAPYSNLPENDLNTAVIAVCDKIKSYTKDQIDLMMGLQDKGHSAIIRGHMPEVIEKALAAGDEQNSRNKLRLIKNQNSNSQNIAPGDNNKGLI